MFTINKKHTDLIDCLFSQFSVGDCIRGDVKIPHSRMTKACWGNIGNPFVISMRQVTKGHLYHLLGVSDYYVMYRQRAKSVL